MPNRCVRCGSFDGRGREMPLPAEWLSYLRAERGVSEPMGRLKLPLCTDCVGEVETMEEREEVPTEFLDSVDTNRLIDDY